MSYMESELSQLNLAAQNPHAGYFDPQQQSFKYPPTKIRLPNHPGTYVKQ